MILKIANSLIKNIETGGQAIMAVAKRTASTASLFERQLKNCN